jgi:hypothetical protein
MPYGPRLKSSPLGGLRTDSQALGNALGRRGAGLQRGGTVSRVSPIFCCTGLPHARPRAWRRRRRAAEPSRHQRRREAERTVIIALKRRVLHRLPRCRARTAQGSFCGAPVRVRHVGNRVHVNRLCSVHAALYGLSLVQRNALREASSAGVLRVQDRAGHRTARVRDVAHLARRGLVTSCRWSGCACITRLGRLVAHSLPPA